MLNIYDLTKNVLNISVVCSFFRFIDLLHCSWLGLRLIEDVCRDQA